MDPIAWSIRKEDTMKRKLFTFLTGLVVMLPTVVLADAAPMGGGDPGVPGCWYLSTDLNSIVGIALVSVSVGIVLRSRRP
jgi:ABC-type Fe3+ transport system permease subunit